MGKRYEEASEIVLKGLKGFEGFYSKEYYHNFEDRILDLKRRIQDSTQEGRLLRIGIVGEVKAGKSSFLNALIFDGKDVLPKASTPMTAALTKITYSEKPSATIVFYSEKDWDRVASYAREYDLEFEKYYNDYKKKVSQLNRNIIDRTTLKTKEDMMRSFNKIASIQLVSCKELTDMFNKSSENLDTYLGQTKDLQIDDLDATLYDYIGANGKYTAIVKHVELRMNNEILQTVEIVDTPGLNDPIISRGEMTKRFLRECDVVFLLSYSGQFLTQEDILFMCETLPNEGIRNIILVGSKFDSGILDDNKSKDIRTACNSSKATYDAQAKENIKRCLTSGYNREVLGRIQSSLPPSYISSVLFSCAKKKKQGVSYSEQEQNIINQLKRHFKDFEDDEKTLLALSGINQIKRNRLFPVMDAKKEIIAERNREILSDNKKILLTLLEDINIQVLQNKDDIEHYDKNQLEKKLQALQSKLNSMRREIKYIFEKASSEADKFLNNMKVDIDLEVDNYIDFNIHSKTRVEHGSYRRGFLGLIKENYTEEIITYTALISDVISNMRNYISRCKKYANEEFEKIINIGKLKKEIKEIVIGAFDLSGSDFREEAILIPLDIVANQIQIPKIDIEPTEFENSIIDAFSGAVVTGDEIHELRLVENKVLGDISKRIKNELDNCNKKIDQVMAEQASTFVDKIIETLKSNVKALKDQIDDRENAIRQYNTLCNALVEYKQLINEMEM